MINKNIINIAIEKNKPVLLIGKHGIGKSYLIQEIAKENNKKLHKFICTSDTTPEDIVGSYELKNGNTDFLDKPLLQAVKNGDWILIDELNTANSSILTLLNGLLETDPNQRFLIVRNENIKPHKDFRLFCTANPSSYAHTQELSDSLLSRFFVLLVNPDYEFFIKKYSQSVHKKKIKAFVSGLLRVQKKLELYISPRELLNFIDLLDSKVKYNEAVNIIINRFYDLSEEKTKQIMELFEISLEKSETLEVYTPEELEKMLSDRNNEANEKIENLKTEIEDTKEKNKRFIADYNATKDNNDKLFNANRELRNKLENIESALKILGIDKLLENKNEE